VTRARGTCGKGMRLRLNGMSELPEPRWLRRYIDHAKDCLGLHAWEILLDITPTPNPEVESADATTYAEPSYLYARIAFRPALVARETNIAKVLVLHELLHVAFALRDQTEDHLNYTLLKPKQRDLFRRLSTQMNEQSVVRLSRALLDLVEPSWQASKAKKNAS